MSRIARVQSLGGRGEGIVRVEGRVVFVPGVYPGELVRFRELPATNKKKERFRHGLCEEVLEPLAERRKTPCTHDHPGGCGGCIHLGLDPAAVARFKTRQLADLLERQGLDTAPIEEPIIPGNGLAYRNHARFLVIKGGRLAYVARRDPADPSRRGKIPIDHCPILHPLVEDLRARLDGTLTGLREVELRAGPTTKERLVILHGDAPPRSFDPTTLDASIILASDPDPLPLRGLPWHHEEINGHRLRISHESFFQGNTDGALTLVDLVTSLAGPAATGFVADLYAGVGLFALTAFPEAPRLLAVEAAPSSIRDLRHNAKILEHQNLTLRGSEVVPVLDDLLAVNDVPDLLIADPPRAGLGPDVTSRLLSLAPPTLILVSCEPRHLATDLATLTRGGYSLSRLIPLDQFAGTHHLEAVALLHHQPPIG